MGKADFMKDVNLGASDDSGDPNQTFNLSKFGTASGDFFYYDSSSGNNYDSSSNNSQISWTFNGSSSGTTSLFGGAAEINFASDGSWSYTVVNSSLFDFTGGPVSQTVTVDVFGSAARNDDPSDFITFNVVCYCAGARVSCKDGECAVEDLEVGQDVRTPDGTQPLVWIGHRRLEPEMLAASPQLLPVELPQDSLGPGLPAAPLRVSPQHRILLASPIIERMFGQEEVLVPAIKLCGHDGIRQVDDGQPVDYYHFATPSHQIVEVNGLLSETLFFGPEARRILGEAAMEELEGIFSELVIGGELMPLARQVVRKSNRVSQALARHTKNEIAPAERLAPLAQCL